jgi:hypothetical protein
MSKRASNAGITLLDTLAYVVIAAILINLCLVAFLNSSRLSAVGTMALDRMNGIRQIEQAFSESVRASAGQVEQVGDFVSGPDTLAMATADPSRFVVFTQVDETPRLSRLELVRNGDMYDVDRAFAYPVDLKLIEFKMDSGSIALEIQLDREQADNRVGVTHRFLATPRLTGGAS